ncbi:hypothetical protein Godav_021855 [Gossypium davidsonii]|uniref:Uncharacterized protein n=1 Tax=Gossypium davidsonii TaxID=34287 RepID=A0A7J8TJH1_GOSDV|nr:hypothetical protein [Gossypium davidsonii]
MNGIPTRESNRWVEELNNRGYLGNLDI